MKHKIMRWTFLFHRWLGGILGGVVLLWLVSGVVMLYFERPQWTEDERLAALERFPPALDLAQLRPDLAWAMLHRPGAPDQIAVRMQDQLPVYVFRQGPNWYRIDEHGRIFGTGDYSPAWAMQRVREVVGKTDVDPGPSPAPSSEKHYGVALVERDQWTVYGSFDTLRPFWKVAVNDAAGHEYYVSMQSGDIVLDTSRRERWGNWAGTVIHWLYFTELRQAGPLWRQVVLWLSGAATLTAIAGVIIGFQRLRAGKRRYAEGRRSPYRDFARWAHHLGGLLVALPLILWLFSGWLSLAPMGFPKATRLTPQEKQQIRPAGLPQPVLAFHPALATLSEYREVEWSQFAGMPTVYLRDKSSPAHLAATDPHTVRESYTDDELYARVIALFPGHAPIDANRIDTPDDEYYPHHSRQTRFPVYRVRFDDDAHTVYYIDPYDAKIVKKIDDPGRRHRWLFRALHLFDFPPLDRNELARQALVWGFSLIGALVAGLGCYVWGKRIFKGMTRLRKS